MVVDSTTESHWQFGMMLNYSDLILYKGILGTWDWFSTYKKCCQNLMRWCAATIPMTPAVTFDLTTNLIAQLCVLKLKQWRQKRKCQKTSLVWSLEAYILCYEGSTSDSGVQADRSRCVVSVGIDLYAVRCLVVEILPLEV